MKRIKEHGKMYRCMRNYLRFGQTHIFLNFTEENLRDLEVINVAYGKGVRIKKIDKHETEAIIYSGEIHIFLDYIDPGSIQKMGTFPALRAAKVLYGDVFKIYLHLYWPIVSVERKTLKISPQYRKDIEMLMNTKGNIRIMKHRNNHRISFEEGFTKITIQKNPDITRPLIESGVKAVNPCGCLEAITTLMVNVGRSNIRHYEPYQIGRVWSHDRRIENVDFKTTATVD